MNQQYKIGDKVLITSSGTVVNANWNSHKKQTEYTLMFEGRDEFFHVVVPEFAIIGVHEQRLTPEEIRALKRGGIEA